MTCLQQWWGLLDLRRIVRPLQRRKSIIRYRRRELDPQRVPILFFLQLPFYRAQREIWRAITSTLLDVGIDLEIHWEVNSDRLVERGGDMWDGGKRSVQVWYRRCWWGRLGLGGR